MLFDTCNDLLNGLAASRKHGVEAMDVSGFSETAQVLADLPAVSAFVWDPVTHTVQISDAAQSLLGITSPQSTDNFLARVHPDNRSQFKAALLALLEAGGSRTEKLRYLHPDGQFRHVISHTSVTRCHIKSKSRIRGILIDVTAERASAPVAAGSAEATDTPPASPPAAARKLASDAFWDIVDAAPVGAYAVDANLNMVRVNRSGLAAFAEIDNLIGRNLDEVLHILWDDPFASDAVAQFRKTLLTGESHHAEPVIEYRADRNVLEAYDWSVERVVLEDGQPGVLCYFYDLSERVRSERVLEEQQLRLSLAYDAARLGAWEVDLLNGLTSGTPQLAAILGQPDFDGDFGDLRRSRMHPDDVGAFDAAFATAARDGTRFDVDFRIVEPDDSVRYMASNGAVTRDRDGRCARMIGLDQDITDRKMAELALRDSEHRLRLVLDQTLAFIGVLDPNGLVLEVNRPAIEFGGLRRADVIGRPFWEAFWWTHDAAIAERCRFAVIEGQNGQTVRYDVVVRGLNDNLITIDFMLAPVFDDAGRLTMIVVSGCDISDREDARARERALMGEINHRTKNILTLVQVVARQTARGGATDFIARFEDRISALSKAQDLLFHSSGDRVDLRDLARSQLDHMRDIADNRIKLNGPVVGMGPQAAQAIGMALHELATNAGKYGALSSDDGYVEVTWTIDDTAGTLDIAWTEHDGPRVVQPKSKGFGSTVIVQMTRSVLNADVDLDYAADGVRWRLSCALKRLT